MPGSMPTTAETVQGDYDPNSSGQTHAGEMALRAASLHLRTSGADNEEAALKLYLRVLEADPENMTALEALDALYRQRVAKINDISYALIIADALNKDTSTDEDV